LVIVAAWLRNYVWSLPISTNGTVTTFDFGFGSRGTEEVDLVPASRFNVRN
jgi:hypothetical protein